MNYTVFYAQLNIFDIINIVNMRSIEICVNGHESAIQAQSGGASRVELCAALPEGGTTPSYGEIRVCVEALQIPVNVIIRSRSGDFLYSNSEIETMIYDIQMCRDLGVNGVVVGALNCDGSIDCQTIERFVKVANGLNVTFHRAFDMCHDPIASTKRLIDLGCNTILTSGQQRNALQGVRLIADLIERYGDDICFMPGCGVTPDNIDEIERKTGASWFHLSARQAVESEMIYRNSNVSMGGTVIIDEYCKYISSKEIVSKVVSKL